jgi:Predicted P-loop ATPase and inactivated derivatives
MDYESIKTYFQIKQDQGDKCKAICPSHQDAEASLSISYDSKDCKTLVHCHAGCETRDILDRVGLKFTDLFDKSQLSSSGSGNSLKVVATYKYRDETGKVLFEKVRFLPKKFTQKREVDGAVVWGLDGGTYYETYPNSNQWSRKKRNGAQVRFFQKQEPVLYNLPELLAAVKKGEDIHVVEGEKDADNLMRLGLTATCNFDGASKNNQKPKWRKEYNKYFKGANVIIIPDNDDAGRAHMNNIFKNITGIASSIKMLKLDVPAKGDASDWLAAEGHTKEELLNLISKLEESEINKDDIKTLDFPFKDYKHKPFKIWENLDYLLKMNSIKVKYNLISREIEVAGNNKSLDEMMVEFNTLALLNGFDLGVDDMARFIKKIAKENSYNPVIDYLKSCKNKWDGTSRIKELCDTIKCYGDIDFKELLIKKWLINAVHIIANKGENNCEGVLVIQGKQGMGKTRWIRSIMPNLDWLKTGVAVDPGDKDSVSKATKYWIVELGEMEATLKKDQAELKQFFTENSDEYREPYGRFSTKFPRLTCFYATVNDLEFLKDVTGNRRYWAIEAISVNVNHKINLEQLWGEVVTLYSTGEITTWLTKEEEATLQDNNIKFEVKSNSEIKLLDKFDWSNTDIKKWSYLTASEIADYIDEKSSVLVGKAIRKLMLNNDLIKFSTNGRKYFLPPKIVKYSSGYNRYA